MLHTLRESKSQKRHGAPKWSGVALRGGRWWVGEREREEGRVRYRRRRALGSLHPPPAATQRGQRKSIRCLLRQVAGVCGGQAG